MNSEKINELVFLLTTCSGIIIIGAIIELFRIFIKYFKINSSHIFLSALIILIIIKASTNIEYSVIAWGVLGILIGIGIIDFLIFKKEIQ